MGSSAARSQFVHTQGTEIVDGSGKPLQIRGISLANWFVLEGSFWGFGARARQSDIEWDFEALLGPTHASEFLHQWRQNFVTREMSTASQKPDSTPFVFHCTAKTSGPTTMKDSTHRQSGQWCRQDHMYVILNFESGTGGFTAARRTMVLISVAAEGRWRAEVVNELWRRVANHYKDDPDDPWLRPVE